ncbi:MAG: EAL domain-containing protein [Gemmiger sp.]|nr:EAL domain-containing protein [Gemmiger sp.]
MQRKLLIVDDQAINRAILKKILGEHYEILEAENGVEALALLRQQGTAISAVLLDLLMPVLDGYAVLVAMGNDPVLADIPVIVASQADKQESESKALQLGARDFIGKPYNADVLRQRLENLIELYESKSCIDRIERDGLTRLYSKEAFCRYATERLEGDPTGDYFLIATDVERFKLVNDSFGTEAGDKLLRYLAERLQAHMAEVGGLCGRHSADHFVALIPCAVEDAQMRAVLAQAEAKLKTYPLPMKITIKFGIYPITARDVPVDIMCDRAILAAASVKGQYKNICAYYDDSVRRQLLKEQQITDEVVTALVEEQFLVYMQPKYDIQSERIAGAEALVRWQHPTLGFMAPPEFIPLFERNGFITELDRYIWDKTCEIVAGWIRDGKKYVPVSVNVSRKDIYQDDLPELLTGIIKKHGLRPSQLHLEITETAYTENPAQLIAVVSKLKTLGFVIEMDDFGNGYSSLNMLSELPIDILKLDMRFIQKETDKNSSRNILSFIISLAKWMNLLVVAEGVETQDQIELLRNMDCNYVQGYYYARPMPAAEFTRQILNMDLADPITVDERDWHEGSLLEHTQTGDKVMLIVDDVQLNRAILVEYFQNAYTIVEADNGQVAYNYIQENFDQIAVILLDLVMPVMDGFQLLERLRANALLRDIPVIVTSQAGETSEAKAFELGASDFLSKPYNIDIALHRVQNVTARNAIQTLEREKRMLTKMKELALEAKLDQLTGLYNRAEMERQVRNYFSVTEAPEAVFIMLDIDNFKAVNDVYGHDCGDKAICQVARILQKQFRAEDMVCRMGGDEFSVFVRQNWNEKELAGILDTLQEALTFQVEQVEISCSIGVCQAPAYGRDYQELYHNADVALLTAKRLGKSQYQLYGGNAELPSRIFYRNMDWLLDESSDAVFICDAETYELHYLNNVATAMAHKEKKDCVGRPCYEVMWNQKEPCSHCIHIDALSTTYCEHEVQPEETENSYIVKGKLIDWGNRKARIQYVQDNTRRAVLARQMEELSEDRRMLLDLLPGGVFRYSARTGKFNFISENMLHMLGYTREEFVAKFSNCFTNMIWPEDRVRVLREIEQQIARATYDVCQYRIEKKDGSLCWVYDAGYFHQTRDGGEYYVILTDITEQKSFELENQRLTRLLETTIDNVPGGVCLYRWDGKQLLPLQISRQFSNVFGLPVAEELKKVSSLQGDAVHPQDIGALRKQIRRMLFHDEPVDAVFRVYNQWLQSNRWVRMQAIAKRQPDGELLVYALYTDITELRALREEVQEQRDMLAAAIRHSGMESWVYDFAPERAGSPAATLPWPETLMRQAGPDAVSPTDETRYRTLMRALWQGRGQAMLDLPVTLKTGERHWLRLMYTTVAKDADGKPQKAIGTARDITEQKIAEQKYEEESVYLHALSASLIASYRINLTTGRVEEAHSRLKLIPDAQRFCYNDANFRSLCARLIPNEREREVCYSMFCPTQLNRDYISGKLEKNYTYPAALPGGKTYWLNLKSTMMRKPSTGELVVFCNFWDTTQEKRTQQVLDRLVETEFDAVCTLDAASGMATVLRGHGLDEVLALQAERGNPVAGQQAHLRRYCHPEDVERAAHQTNLQTVRQALETQPLYRVRYRVLLPTGQRCKRVDYCYLDDDKDTILCMLQDCGTAL